MAALKLTVGSLAALLMVTSGLVHSTVGWRELNRILRDTKISPAVRDGLAVPWHFAGLSMAAFGLIVAVVLWRARSGGMSTAVLLIVGSVWLLVGAAGMLTIKVDATFLLFLIPGLLVLFAAA